MSARTVALWAALLAAAPAQAYQQTKTIGGVGLRWPSNSVTFMVNTARAGSSPSCGVNGTTDPSLEAVKAAFATWSAATHPGDAASCTALSLQYGGVSSSTLTGSGTAAEHLVVFRKGWCTTNAAAIADGCIGQSRPGTNNSEPACNNKFNCFDDTYGGLTRSVLALTTVMYYTTGAIADADMEVVDWDGAQGQFTTSSPPPDGWYWTCFDPTNQARCTSYGQDGCYFMDLQNTVTHEAGHFIGLAHPCENTQAAATANGVPLCTTNPAFAQTTMYPSAATGETSKRTLAADDINGVCAIYPLSGGTTPPSSHSSGGCGSGGATPVGLGALALALMALFPRARRRTRR